MLFLAISLCSISCTATKNYAPVRSSSESLSKVYDQDYKVAPQDYNVVGQYYIVKRGDTLYSISSRFKLSYQQLAVFNKIPPPYILKIGQRIRLNKSKKGSNKQLVRRNASVTLSKKRDSSQNLSRVERSSSQIKSTNSNDNKKVLKFVWQWPVIGKVIKNFSQTGNTGIDINGKAGQKVRSSASGKVVYSGSGLKTYGNLIIIKHNYLYLSAYANNSKLFVEEGQDVKKGQVIAEMGGVGLKKALLHFEIRKNGTPVDPFKYLPKK
ncbi:MAG: peptidoglycan DD-metalloendopeptidase family protein [Methylococcaceae bacterium]|nr:peptidoglycan DD-metalloendopeptidase family protein [Methylococcaceae bacterium]